MNGVVKSLTCSLKPKYAVISAHIGSHHYHAEDGKLKRCEGPLHGRLR